MGRIISSSMGDSGMWGSLSMMNATRNAKQKPRPTAAGNRMAKAMLTGKMPASNKMAMGKKGY